MPIEKSATDPAAQIARFNELIAKRTRLLDETEDEFDAQRIRVMDSLCERLDNPEWIDADWFKAQGQGLLKAHAAMKDARRRLDDIREIGAAMQREDR
jgi:hypothetical protein